MIQQNSDYDIISAAEVANIIGHFPPEMLNTVIMTAIYDNSKMSYGRLKPNLVKGIESMYKDSLEDIGEFSQDILSARDTTYANIISIMCNHFNFELTPAVDANVDKYTLADIMYNFLIYDFSGYLVEFLSAYIIRESAGYAELLNNIPERKEASAYTKKMFKGENQDIGIIYANLDWVLEQVMVADITFYDMVSLSLNGANMHYGVGLCNYVRDKGNFFADKCQPIIRENAAYVITSVKLNLQNRISHNIAEFIEFI